MKLTTIFGMALVVTLSGCRPDCEVDSDCPDGEVCELSTGCEEPMQCVPGCRDDSQCTSGEVCNQIQCVTCPCPGICEAPPSDDCRSDSDCPSGAVCELSTGCEEPMQCVPGCRDDSQCTSGEVCNQVQCVTCPCPGICEGRSP